MVRGTKEPYAPRHRCQAGKPVGNESLRLALHCEHGGHNVACIGGANALCLRSWNYYRISLSGSNRADPTAEIHPDVWRDVVRIRLSAMQLLLSLYTLCVSMMHASGLGIDMYWVLGGVIPIWRSPSTSCNRFVGSTSPLDASAHVTSVMA